MGKKIMMFSYGSGCAASMFVIKVVGDYSVLRAKTSFRERLENRVKISPEEFDRWMAHREIMFGKANYIPTVSVLGIIFNRVQCLTCLKGLTISLKLMKNIEDSMQSRGRRNRLHSTNFRKFKARRQFQNG
jgi:3-hydroxy-3-methylglutaryl CoA synthase